jgi:hypothetical protein
MVFLIIIRMMKKEQDPKIEPPPINTDIQIGQLIYHLCVINKGGIGINKAHINEKIH